MAVAFVAKATGTKAAGSGLNLTVTVPTGTLNGHVMLAFVTVRNSAAVPATPSGWNLIDDEAGGPSAASYWRIASSEPASYTWVVSDAVVSMGYIATYSGADGTSPVDQFSVWNRVTGTTSVTATTITPSVDNCMVVWAGIGASASTLTDPGTYTGRGIVTTTGPIVLNLADLLQTTATATGSVTGTAGSSGNAEATLISLKPPTAAGAADPYPYVDGGYYPTQG